MNVLSKKGWPLPEIRESTKGWEKYDFPDVEDTSIKNTNGFQCLGMLRKKLKSLYLEACK